MINNTIKLLDIVALTVDLPEHNLRRGESGTVVELLAGGTAFEVEFSDDNGKTYESIGLRSDQLIILKRFKKRSKFNQQFSKASKSTSHATKK